MLTINEYPIGWYNIHNELTGESITGLNLDELDVVRRMIEGVRVAKQPEPKKEGELHPVFQEVLDEHIKGVN